MRMTMIMMMNYNDNSKNNDDDDDDGSRILLYSVRYDILFNYYCHYYFIL